VDGKVCIVGLGIDISERKRAEEMLRDAQSRLQLAVRASAIGLWNWDVCTSEIFYSAEWKAQLGYAPHELSNSFEEWRERLHPEERAEILRELDAIPLEQKSGAPIGSAPAPPRWIIPLDLHPSSAAAWLGR
jgi:PAS domain-containing protein